MSENQLTDEKLTFESILALFKETDKQFKETAERFKETDKQFKETAERFKETDKKFKETDEKFKETDEKFKETDEKFKERDKSFQETKELIERNSIETDRKFQETDKQFKNTQNLVKELSKNIGGLNNKFGSFTEGLFIPSLKRILTKDFGLTNFMPNAYASNGSDHLELDILSYSNGNMNIAIIVEIKSHLKSEHIEKMQIKLQKARIFFPFLKDLRVYGMIASVRYNEELRNEVLKAGLYFSQIHNETFQLDIPEGFQPINY